MQFSSVSSSFLHSASGFRAFNSDIKSLATEVFLALTAAWISVRWNTCRWAQLPPNWWKLHRSGSMSCKTCIYNAVKPVLAGQLGTAWLHLALLGCGCITQRVCSGCSRQVLLGGCIRQVDYRGAEDHIFVQVGLGLLHLGCNREVAALLRWLLTRYNETMADPSQRTIPMSLTSL